MAWSLCRPNGLHTPTKKGTILFGGSSEYALLPQGESFLIKRKKSILINDVVNVAVDLTTYNFLWSYACQTTVLLS